MSQKRWMAATVAAVLMVGAMSAASDRAQAQQVSAPEDEAACPHPEGWRPTAEELKRTLARHRGWMLGHGLLMPWSDDALLKLLGPLELDWRLEARTPEKANLCNADLSLTTLTNAHLSEANLTHTDLRWTDLTKANLFRATLTNADLFAATLTDADLRGAILTDAHLGTNLTDADLIGADLTKAKLIGATLTGTKLAYVDLTRVSPRFVRKVLIRKNYLTMSLFNLYSP